LEKTAHELIAYLTCGNYNRRRVFCINVTSGCMINYPLFDAIHEKSIVHKEATHVCREATRVVFIIETQRILKRKTYLKT